MVYNDLNLSKSAVVTQVQELDRMFHPTSIAVIGASKNETAGGGLLLKGIITNGFAGRLYPVNPNETEIMGLRSYRNILDIPDEVDVAIIAVSAHVVTHVMGECSRKRVKFAVVHSVGFSELGNEGHLRQEEMLSVARQGGVRVLGPNCMGLFCPESGINTVVSRLVFKKEAGTVALVAQSGWVSENFILTGHECGLRYSKVVSIGNQSDLTIEDFLAYLADDAGTKVIAFYIEGLKRAREFFELAKQISKKKPIIVWKGGRSEVGVRAAASHTASLAGNKAIFDAALAQAGATPARCLDELIDLAIGFTSPLLPRGSRVGLLVEAGGGGVAAADAAESLGLQIPTLSSEAQREIEDELKGVVPPFSTPSNPVDLVWVPVSNKVQPFVQCARIVAREVDAIIMLSYGVYDELAVRGLVALREEIGKPVFLIPGHVVESREGMSLLTKNGIPSFTTPERAAKVLAAMVGYTNHLNRNGDRKSSEKEIGALTKDCYDREKE